MKKERVANGIFWVEIPEADLRILCGCPADSVKHLFKRGLIAPVSKAGRSYETGPNAILLSDTPIQKGSFANLAEFPLLQMLYRQGMIIPGHPNNTGRKPLLIGLGDQVRSQGSYFFRGNYGLSSVEEIRACGVPPEAAADMFRVKRWFAFDSIRETSELVETRALDADAVELAPGVVVHRKGFNRYEFLSEGESLEVDLTLGPGEEYEPAYTLPAGGISPEFFSVIHIGEGDGWDIHRPCMASIVCFHGLLYLVDAGPHILRSLEALGISAGDIEGIFHSHVHDDHFAGLTSLVRSERRMKYYAASYVRATAQKKLAALMRIDEERFSRFFEVHDLTPHAWNDIAGLEVKPVYSPHPVETTVLFFRVAGASGARTYAHLADIPSFDVLGRLAAERSGQRALSEPARAAFEQELLSAVDLKKIDVGGGLIHGSALDFAGDKSQKIVLSHGITSIPDELKGIATTVSFGDADVLIGGGAAEHFLRTARSSLASWFPGCSASDLEDIARSAVRDYPPGAIVRTVSDKDCDVRLILSGMIEETDPATGENRRLGTGALVGASPGHFGETAASDCRAASAVSVLTIPAGTYRELAARSSRTRSYRLSASNRGFLTLCPLFSGIKSENVLNAIAAAMERRQLRPGQSLLPGTVPEIFLLVEGAVDLAVGERLIESIGPGGFWGEERIVSSGLVLGEARAASDCSFFAIPADILTGIPIVQWGLLETFERRLKSFEKRFRFEWSESFRVGVKALDEQHSRLFALVNDLSDLVGKTKTLDGLDHQKEELLDYTRLHFKTEESLMESHGYPRLEVQRREHRDLLARMERFGDTGERRARPRAETAVDYLKDWLIRHTLLEDLKYKEFFLQKQVR